jgi:hypothetical protein
MLEPRTQHPLGDLTVILLATDGGLHSEGAVKEVIRLARACNTRLHVLRLFSYKSGFSDETSRRLDDEFRQKMESETTPYFERIRELAAAENVECESSVKNTTNIAQAIVDKANALRSDLIVMGRRGLSGIKKLLLGSVTSEVIGLAQCKILVVPQDASIKGESILLATDGSDFSAVAEAEAVSAGLKCPQLKQLIALSVASSDSETNQAKQTVEKFKATAESKGVKVEAIVKTGKPAQTIMDVAKEQNADMIIMGTHGRTGIQKAIIGSVASQVVSSAHCAVLVVKS